MLLQEAAENAEGFISLVSSVTFCKMTRLNSKTNQLHRR
jgi:hypothetical protein